MGSCCFYKEFLKELDYIKSEMNVWGHNYDLMQTVWALKNKVKDFFPINGVPEEIMHSLKLLEDRMRIASDQMSLTCERIIIEVERLRQEQYADA